MIKDYFYGEHETSYGDKWRALFSKSEKLLEEIAPNTIKCSKVISIDEFDDVKYLIQFYVETAPVGIIYISEIKDDEKKISLVSAYPQLYGKKNKLQLKNTYVWEIQSEGEMAGKLADVDKELIINFHNTLFFKDNKGFCKDEIKTVSFAGLAYNISKLDECELPIDEGNFYEHILEEFLKNNPNKTEADFEKPVLQVTADSIRAFNPTKYTCKYDAIGQIKDVQYINFFDVKVAIMCVEFAKSDSGQPFYCNVYATEKVLNDYTPKVGDGITTRIWLTGYFEPAK